MAGATFTNQMNKILGGMRTNDMKKKGTKGEEAVFALCEKLYQRHGGILYHSYAYKVDKNLPGNIKKDDSGTLFVENLGDFTEIDVLYVSPYKVFPIEVKSYSSKEIILTDDGISGVRNGHSLQFIRMRCIVDISTQQSLEHYLKEVQIILFP